MTSILAYAARFKGCIILGSISSTNAAVVRFMCEVLSIDGDIFQARGYEVVPVVITVDQEKDKKTEV